MSMKLTLITCPECEGVGKAVNYFDLPKDLLGLSSPIVDDKKYRSDGRGYYDHPCVVCNGRCTVLVVKRG